MSVYLAIGKTETAIYGAGTKKKKKQNVAHEQMKETIIVLNMLVYNIIII